MYSPAITNLMKSNQTILLLFLVLLSLIPSCAWLDRTDQPKHPPIGEDTSVVSLLSHFNGSIALEDFPEFELELDTTGRYFDKDDSLQVINDINAFVEFNEYELIVTDYNFYGHRTLIEFKPETTQALPPGTYTLTVTLPSLDQTSSFTFEKEQ